MGNVAPKARSRMKRRAKGTGSRFYSESRQEYGGRVIVGRKPDGSPDYRTRFGKTATEVERKLSLVEPPTDETTVGAWLSRWLSEMKVKPGTRRSRVAAVEHHLSPSLGHLPVAKLTPRQVEVAAGQWKLKPTSARNVCAILGTAMRAAVRAGIRTDNPVQAAHKPRTPKKKTDPFTAEEVRRVSREAERQPNTLAIALLAATGMRAGEALALDCPDFDPATGQVSITKTLDCADRNLLGTPKSDNSERVIRVPAEPKEGLSALKKAIGSRTEGPVFRTATGKRTVYNVLYVAWAALLKRLSLRYRGMHQLRHSWASHALAADVDVAEVAAYLGNTPAEVLKTYAHAMKKTDPASAMERFFRGQGDDRGTKGTQKRAARRKTKGVK